MYVGLLWEINNGCIKCIKIKGEKTVLIKKQKTEKTVDAAKTIKVTRAREFENGGLLFDMVVNEVTIYGCQWVEGEKNGKEYAFVSFPSRQSKKDKKWYNIAYVKLTDEETKEIERQIDSLL